MSIEKPGESPVVITQSNACASVVLENEDSRMKVTAMFELSGGCEPSAGVNCQALCSSSTFTSVSIRRLSLSFCISRSYLD